MHVGGLNGVSCFSSCFFCSNSTRRRSTSFKRMLNSAKSWNLIHVLGREAIYPELISPVKCSCNILGTFGLDHFLVSVLCECLIWSAKLPSHAFFISVSIYRYDIHWVFTGSQRRRGHRCEHGNVALLPSDVCPSWQTLTLGSILQCDNWMALRWRIILEHTPLLNATMDSWWYTSLLQVNKTIEMLLFSDNEASLLITRSPHISPSPFSSSLPWWNCRRELLLSDKFIG